MPHPRRAIPLAQWPHRDQTAWEHATQDADPLFEPGRASRWRPKTLRSVITRYGLWLAWLTETGLLDPNACPAGRVTRESLAAYVHYLRARGCAPVTIAGCIRDLREAIRVMQPNADLTVLTDVLVRLDCAAEPSRDKRLRIVSPDLLLRRALSEMRRLRSSRKPPTRRTANSFRDALIVAFLATRPIRLEDLALIELGRHLIQVGDRYWCKFTALETKEKRPLEFPMPELLTPWLDRYLTIYRLLLLRDRRTPRLWISIRSTPMADNSVYCRVIDWTERLIGAPVNPHLFRDCVATFVAIVAPEEIGIVSQILGHSTLRTAEQHYNHAGMLRAGHRYHQALQELRGEPDLPSKEV